MPQLMRHKARGEAEGVTHLVQVVAELTNERFFGERASQEPSVSRQWIEGTKESEALDQFTNKEIHGDHAFRLEFAKWYVNRPLIRARGTETVAHQIGTFTDAHAGVANQQKGIATQVVAAEEFLLQEFILLCRERTWKSLWEAWNVLAADQMGEFRKLFGPSQFVTDAAQGDEQVDIGRGRERGCLRVQAGHPAEDVEFTAQLVQALHLRMISTEIAQEIACGPTVVTSGVGTECHGEGIDRAVEDRNQRMLQRRAWRAIHEEITGRGRMCCATARAYSR